MQGGEESSLANHPGTILALGHLFTKEIRVKRKDLIKLLYKPVEEVEAISKELYEKIIQRYPVIESIINLVNKFKQMLKLKNVEKVGEWIEKANNLKIRIFSLE